MKEKKESEKIKEKSRDISKKEKKTKKILGK